MPPGQHHLERGNKDLVARALGNEAHGTEVDGTHDVVAEVGCGDDDDRHRGIGRTKLLEQSEAVFVPELQVEQRQIEVGADVQCVACGLRTGDGDDLDPLCELLHNGSHRVQDQRMVVDHEDVHGGLPGSSECDGRACRRKMRESRH
jgi:hypothetical protein